MSHLAGKRILLVVPRFFGYEREIKGELERQGARVDWLPDRPFDSSVLKAVTKIRPQLVFPAADRLYDHLLSEFGATHYDYVLVVNGQTLSTRTLNGLRARFPSAQYILYMWDAFANRPNFRDQLLKFDHVFTFDPQDAAHYRMRLRPLFFGRGFEPSAQLAMRYHISFVGTAHTDRFAIVDQLKNDLPAGISAYWYLYLQAPWVFHAYRWTKPGMRNARAQDFRFEPLDKKTLLSVFAQSRAILDIEHPQQIGLTMRTFETLGAGKKLVTTNRGVRDYDFYSEENICVIDRNAPHVPAEFLDAPFKPVPESVRHRYSIEGWVAELFQDSGAAVTDR